MRMLAAIAVAVAILAALILPLRVGREAVSDLYINPQPVRIEGYSGVEMEPFISPDGRFLFFNNSNERGVVTQLHFAQRTGPLTFKYLGELAGAGSSALDGIPSMDRADHFYFMSPREYEKTRKSIFTGDFDGKGLKNVRPVPGEIWPRHLGSVNMDIGVTPDGATMYISRATFIPPLPLPAPIRCKLLVAHLQDGAWSIDSWSAEIMKNINTRALAYAPAISPDGRELYFTRAGIPGGMRIMVATRPSQDVPFDDPRVLVELTTGEVEAPTVSTDLSELFFHKKLAGRWAIFRATRKSGAMGRLR